MKKYFLHCVLFSLLLFHCFSAAANDFWKVVTSPSGEVALKIMVGSHDLNYSVKFRGEDLIRPSALGMVFQGGDSLKSFRVLAIKETSGDQVWTPVWGQYSSIRDQYNECLLQLTDEIKGRRMDVRFRIYNDGVAFRYEFPEVQGTTVLSTELSSFNFAGNYECWWLWADYNTLEKLYTHSRIRLVPHAALPFTMQNDKGVCLSIYEAELVNYPMLSLRQQEDSSCFIANLAPLADGSAAHFDGSFRSPWRVIQIAPDAARLLESSLVLNLNEPCALKDVSWIKPTTYIGIWWEMHLGVSTWAMEGGRHGATTENARRYVDFAASHGIHAVLFEGWNTGWEQWGKPGAFDFTTSYPDFALKEIVDYARSKGVEIIGHHETGGDVITYEARMDSAFAFYRRIGIRYVKTGYAGPVNPPTENHHGQYMVNHFNKVMETAARYGIMLDVHEPVIPSGLSRTWPNLMSFEGVRGMEWNAWSEGNPPSHTCTLPFTRGLAGPMDYTPGIFDINEDHAASKRIAWNALDKGNNGVHSTLTNQIALMVVLYSPLQMAADMIENYEGNQAFDFISALPASWDETRVLAASIGEYVIVARRSGNNWFVAGITNEKARDFNLPLNFLETGKEYTLKSCSDGKDADYEKNPESYTISTEAMNASKTLKIHMATGGGSVAIFFAH
jgi:alpha-glucosidase